METQKESTSWSRGEFAGCADPERRLSYPYLWRTTERCKASLSNRTIVCWAVDDLPLSSSCGYRRPDFGSNFTSLQINLCRIRWGSLYSLPVRRTASRAGHVSTIGIADRV